MDQKYPKLELGILLWFCLDQSKNMSNLNQSFRNLTNFEFNFKPEIYKI